MALPVLGAGVGVHDEGIGSRPLEHGVDFLGEGVGDGDEGEGVALRRPVVLLVLARVAPDLGEALVGEDAAAGRMGLDGVEDGATGLVLVPALVDELADGAAAERLPVAVDLVEGAGEGWLAVGVDGVVVEEGEEVADAGEAEVHDARALCVVDQLVDPAGLEAAFDVEVDGRRRQLDAAVRLGGARQLPLGGGDGQTRVLLVLAPGQHGAGAVAHRVALNVGAAADRQREDAGRVSDELLADAAAQRLAALARLRQVGDDVAAAGDEVALPAGPDDGVALAHEEAVAGVGSLRQVGAAAVVEAHGAAAAAIGELVEEAAVAAAEVDRLEDVEVGGELDEAGGVARREVEVDDGGQAGRRRVDGEVDLADQALVGARIAEGGAGGEVDAFEAVEADLIAYHGSYLLALGTGAILAQAAAAEQGASRRRIAAMRYYVQ